MAHNFQLRAMVTVAVTPDIQRQVLARAIVDVADLGSVFGHVPPSVADCVIRTLTNTAVNRYMKVMWLPDQSRTADTMAILEGNGHVRKINLKTRQINLVRKWMYEDWALAIRENQLQWHYFKRQHVLDIQAYIGDFFTYGMLTDVSGAPMDAEADDFLMRELDSVTNYPDRLRHTDFYQGQEFMALWRDYLWLCEGNVYRSYV